MHAQLPLYYHGDSGLHLHTDQSPSRLELALPSRRNPPPHSNSCPGLLPAPKDELMAAAGNPFFNQELAMTVNEMVDRYFAASSHGAGRYQSARGTAPVTVGAPDVGYLVAGIGMVPSSFVMPDGALAAAGYGAVAAVPAGVAVAPAPQQQQARAGGSNGNPGSFKGAWTREEDEVLKQMVRHHGDRKWAAIAKSLPGRIGKQCRERWTNHLRPDIKKDVWTEEDDRVLIEAHKTYGNRWSAIARCLSGRSENAVKNHWNATKRSLKSKRRLKKKKSEQAAPGQLSLLEEYIRSQCPPVVDDVETAAPPAPLVTAHLSENVAYGTGLAGPGPRTAAAQAPAGSNPSGIGWFLNLGSPAGSPPAGPAQHQLGMMNLNMPPVPDNNAYGAEKREGCYLPFAPLPGQGNLHNYGLHLRETAPPVQLEGISPRGMHVPFLRLCDDQFAGIHATGGVEYDCQSSNQANVGAGYYSETGPSSAGGSGDPDDIDVVQMASRQFLMPSEDEVTLDLTRFK